MEWLRNKLTAFRLRCPNRPWPAKEALCCAPEIGCHFRLFCQPWPIRSGGLPREEALTFAVMARTRDLKLAAGGEVCAELAHSRRPYRPNSTKLPLKTFLKKHSPF